MASFIVVQSAKKKIGLDTKKTVYLQTSVFYVKTREIKDVFDAKILFTVVENAKLKIGLDTKKTVIKSYKNENKKPSSR